MLYYLNQWWYKHSKILSESSNNTQHKSSSKSPAFSTYLATKCSLLRVLKVKVVIVHNDNN